MNEAMLLGIYSSHCGGHTFLLSCEALERANHSSVALNLLTAMQDLILFLNFWQQAVT